jgi:hypothetical protein
MVGDTFRGTFTSLRADAATGGGQDLSVCRNAVASTITPRQAAPPRPRPLPDDRSGTRGNGLSRVLPTNPISRCGSGSWPPASIPRRMSLSRCGSRSSCSEARARSPLGRCYEGRPTYIVADGRLLASTPSSIVGPTAGEEGKRGGRGYGGPAVPARRAEAQHAVQPVVGVGRRRRWAVGDLSRTGSGTPPSRRTSPSPFRPS